MLRNNSYCIKSREEALHRQCYQPFLVWTASWECFDQDDGDDEKKRRGLPNYVDRVARRFVFFDDYEVNIKGPEHGRQLRAVPIMNWP